MYICLKYLKGIEFINAIHSQPLNSQETKSAFKPTRHYPKKYETSMISTTLKSLFLCTQYISC